jgi:hypothetical protein
VIDGTSTPTPRRVFLRRAGTALLALAVYPRTGWALGRLGAGGPHPTPRPGVTAEKVLTADALAGFEDVLPTFDKVRQIPGIVDGIRCHCGCADLPGFYSLLSCYEEAGMARHCYICQGEANLAFRLHSDGKTLAEIREAIDARYG